MAKTRRKRPWLAAGLALLYPGLGHVYLREWLRAILWFGLIVSTSALLVPEVPVPAEFSVDAIISTSMTVAQNTPLRYKLVLIAITALSMADAYWVATKGNRRVDAEDGTQCPHCGHDLDEDLSFCHWCTTRLD